MGEALEQAKKKLGLGKNNPGSENKGAVSSLEEVLSTIDNLDARDALRARVREVTANANLRATEAEEQLKRRGGANVGDEEKKREEDKRIREEISTTAILLLEKGMDPKVVAQYISGSSPVTPITIAPSGAPGTQGLTIDDVIKIMNLSTEGKGTSELTKTLDALNKAIEKLGQPNNRGQPQDPIEFARHQAAITQAYVNTLKELGVIKEPVVTTAGGQSLEVSKEDHRHEEKMEEIKVDQVYKGKLGEAVASLPEKIGRGLGSQITEESEGSSNESGGLECIDCTAEVDGEVCGQKIYITPDTGHQVTCPKCGAIYERKAPVKTKEAPVETKSKAPAETKKGK